MSIRKQLKQLLLELQEPMKKWDELDRRAAIEEGEPAPAPENEAHRAKTSGPTFALDAENILLALQALLEDYQDLIAKFVAAMSSAEQIRDSQRSNVEEWTLPAANVSAMSCHDYYNSINSLCNQYIKEYGTKELMIKDLRFDTRSETMSIYQVVWKNRPFLLFDDSAEDQSIFTRISLDTITS